MSKKILVVDDEPDLLKMTVARLKKAGYVVVQAVDGENGLSMMVSEKPDAVLLDLRMPGIDGYEVCRRKKEDDAIKDIPILLFTASLSNELLDERKVRDMGISDYVIKPFDVRELLEKIKKALGER